MTRRKNANRDRKNRQQYGDAGSKHVVPPSPNPSDVNAVEKPKADAKSDVTNDPKSIAAETLKRVKVTEVSMIVLTAVIAASSVATCVVYKGQLGVMREQLGEIRSGGKDTHNLAVAAGDQAKGIRDLATQTKRSADAVSSAQFTCGPAIAPDFHLIPAAPPAPVGSTAIGQILRVQFEIDSMGGSPISQLTITMSADAVRRGSQPVFGHEPVIATNAVMASLGQLRVPHGGGVPFIDLKTGKPLGPLTPQIVADIASGGLRLLVHGSVRYIDSVGCHVETSARVFDPSVNNGAGTFMPYEAHNGETIDCKEWDRQQQNRR